jgi:hypothetical protein
MRVYSADALPSTPQQWTLNSSPTLRQLIKLLRRLLIREANYLRGPVGPSPVKADAKGRADAGPGGSAEGDPKALPR